ncbi:MAG: PIN domain nuclease [Smithellaceae bacterium]
MLLVDSSVWIDYFNGRITPQTNHLDAILGIDDIVIGDLIFTEVLQGFRHDKDYEAAKKALYAFPILSLGGSDMALKSANNYRLLRKRGITIRKTIDCFIATFCIEHALEILHADNDFDPFEQHLRLKVVHP